MAYLDYPGLSYFKSLLDETYLRTSYTGDTTIAGDVTFTGDTVFSEDITGNVDGKAKKDWRGQQIDSTYIKDISTNDNVGQIVYTKGDGTSNYIMIDMMQGATASVAGKAGLVPAPTISERVKFLRGDGEWAVPTDIYVTQNLISTNDSFPILIGATAGATQSQVGTAIAFGTKVSVNPNTHTLIADHLILKHPTYRRSNNVSSKIMYTLNFADSDDGNGNNLSEIYGYIDPVADGGEHELGFRLFGNPNVQGVEEIFTYLSVGLSKTNIPYGHAPKTPIPLEHNEDTDIITRSYLKLNGSITGLVHTSMNETIDGTKTFVKKIVANDGMNATGNVATDSLTVRQNATVDGTLGVTGTSTLDGNVHMLHNLDVDGTANVDGASTLHGDVHMYNNLDVDKNANIDGNETVGGTLTTTGKLTANGTAEIKGGGNGNSLTVTGNEYVSGNSNIHGNLDVDGNTNTDGNQTIGGTLGVTGKITGNNGLEVTGNIKTTTLTTTGNASIGGNASVSGNETIGGTLTSTGKITGNGGAEISGGNGLKVNGNETVTGKLTAEDLEATDDLTVGDTATIGGQILKKTGTNTTQEYVSYVTNQQETRNTIITNVVKPNGGLAIVDSGADKGKIYVKTGNALEIDSNGFVNVDFSKLPPDQVKSIVDRMVDPDGAIIGSTQEYIPAGETYHYYDNNGNLVSAVAPAGGIANPNYGKLTVDFSKLSRSQIEAIVLSMIAQDGQGHLTGGLATDDNGKLIVDFSQMPDDRFDTLKASLGMQRTVTSSTRTFYVDYDSENASDTVYTKATGFDGERGLSLDKPFKTINGAVTGITTYYSLGNQGVTIYVVPRHVESNPNYPYYRESLSLPTYNRTSGAITIRGYVPEGMSENNSYVVDNNETVAPMPKILSSSVCGSTISVNGYYNIRYLELHNRVRDPASSANTYPSIINVGTTGEISLYGIQEHFEFYGHRGVVGTLEINSDSAPTSIVMNSTASTTYAVDIMNNGEFLGYKYDYDASTHKEAERERPELRTVSTINVEGTDTNFDNYITIVSCNYDSTNKKIILKYTFERGNSNITSTTFYVKVDNSDFITVTPTYDQLEPTTGIYARMNVVVGGKIHLGIADKLNTKLVFNLGEKHSSTETFVPNLNMFSGLCVLRAERGGKIENSSSSTVGVPYTNIYCKGNTVNFGEFHVMASYSDVAGQRHHMHYVVKPGDTVTGRPFTLSGGSGMSITGPLIEQDSSTWVRGNAGYAFPGTDGVYGTVEDEEGFNSENPNYGYRKGGSGCWYRENSSLGL